MPGILVSGYFLILLNVVEVSKFILQRMPVLILSVAAVVVLVGANVFNK